MWAVQTQIGEVMGSRGGSGGVVDGVAFDKVIPIEIESPLAGGVVTLKLGFNYTGACGSNMNNASCRRRYDLNRNHRRCCDVMIRFIFRNLL